MLGDDASALRHMLELSYPMENGIVRNWEEMQHVWDYTFGKTKLNIDPSECKILLTEPPMNPLKNREKLIEVSRLIIFFYLLNNYIYLFYLKNKVMFEKYGFAGCHVSIQAVLTLYAQGLVTGIVLDSGDGVTHICPVYEGFSLPHITKRLDIAGRDITRYLIKVIYFRLNFLCCILCCTCFWKFFFVSGTSDFSQIFGKFIYLT